MLDALQFFGPLDQELAQSTQGIIRPLTRKQWLGHSSDVQDKEDELTAPSR